MNVKIIQTGSKGNSTIINSNVMIDCGTAYKKIHQHVFDLKLVLLTHIHS